MEYDRVIYQLGNSHFHDYQIKLMEDIPGVLVLHDFFVSGLVRYEGYSRRDRVKWLNSLYLNHGFSALYQLQHGENEDDIPWAYPCNAKFVENSKAIIVHSEYASKLAAEWLGKEEADRWNVIPLLRLPSNADDATHARQRLGFKENDLIFCCFGHIGPMKSNLEVLNGWLKSEVARDPKAKLIFVGNNSDDEYGKNFSNSIEISGLSNRIHITGWIEDSTFHDYLSVCNIAIQLRTLSRGETSAAVLDCMTYGIPTIVNANGSMAEIPTDSVYMMPDVFTLDMLTSAIDDLHSDAGLRNEIRQNARRVIAEKHSPQACAESYHDVIEKHTKCPHLQML